MKKKVMNVMEAFSKAMVQPLMYLSVDTGNWRASDK